MTKTTILYPRWPLYATALAFSLLLVAPAHAAGSGMPWEAPLQSILESIEGPVAKYIGGSPSTVKFRYLPVSLT